MYHTDNILNECSYLSKFMYFYFSYINNSFCSIVKEHVKLFPVLEKKVFKNSFPVSSLEKENNSTTYQACLIPGMNCLKSQEVKV